MEEQERRFNHPFYASVHNDESEDLLRSSTLINEGDDEESLLSVLPSSINRADSRHYQMSSSASGAASRFRFFGNGTDHATRRWKRWTFFLCGFLFFVAFFTMLLLLFFDVIHVAEDHHQSGGSTTAPRGRFFQLSDIHMDLLYNAAFNRTTFCRLANSTDAGNASARLGSPSRGSDPTSSPSYGQYGCDSPAELVKSALGAMGAVDSKPDFILITGDIVAHSQPSWAMQNQTVTQFTSMLRQVFPNTLVLPLLGNNDVYPDYHQPYGPTAWLEYLAALWSPWLDEEQRATFVSGGYYSMKIPVAHNLRVIALNTVPYSVNFVPRNDTQLDPYDSCNASPPTDPNGQFGWLKDELTRAKLNNEKVILAGHIPYGINEYDGSINWCAGYVDSFLTIIYPFVEDVIVNQIFAHYHLDEFRVLLSPASEEDEATSTSKPKAVSSVMIHPSISPLHDNNPSFRYYHYYRETGAIVDYAHFYLDLALVNLMPAPRWALEYTFQGAYSVSGVDTKSFAWVWETITSGFSSHFARYFSFKTALYIDKALPNLCALSSTGQDDYQRCLGRYSADAGRSEL